MLVLSLSILALNCVWSLQISLTPGSALKTFHLDHGSIVLFCHPCILLSSVWKLPVTLTLTWVADIRKHKLYLWSCGGIYTCYMILCSKWKCSWQWCCLKKIFSKGVRASCFISLLQHPSWACNLFLYGLCLQMLL
jgi:hypothetical protein